MKLTHRKLTASTDPITKASVDAEFEDECWDDIEESTTIEGDSIVGYDDLDEEFEYDEEFDEIPSFRFGPEATIPVIQRTLGIDDEEIARTIYNWYDIEGAWEDFDSLEDFADFLQSDIWNMLDACDDEGEKEVVADAISASTEITASEYITWMGKYNTIDGNVKKVYFDLDSRDFEEAEDYFFDCIPEPYTRASLLGTAPAQSLLEKDGFVPLDACTNVTGSIDTGLDYWYRSRHGMGPGTIPQGVRVLDWYEDDHWNTWMLLDQMLTTSELNEYELKEEFPPAGAITHNGDEIVACDDIEGSEDVEARRNMDAYNQATERSAYPGGKFGAAFYKGYKLLFDSANKLWGIWRNNSLVEDGFADKGQAIDYINQGLVAASTDVEGADQYDDKEYDDGMEEYEDEYSGDLMVFENKFYGTPIDTDSYDGSIMNGWCPCVGYDSDEEGYNWACFTKENWEKVKDLPLEEIHRKYADRLYKANSEWERVEGGTLEENQKALEEYLVKQEEMGKQLDDLQQDMLNKSTKSWFGRKKRIASATEPNVDGNFWYTTESETFDEDFLPEDVICLDDLEDDFGTHYIVVDRKLTRDEAEQLSLTAITPDAEIFQASAVYSSVWGSECTQVDETDDSIDYVVSSEDIEGMSLVRYGDYKIMPNMDSRCWEVLSLDNDLIETGFKTESDAKAFVDGSCDEVLGGEEIEEVEEEDEFDIAPEQEYKSAETAINGKQGKLPAVFKKASIPHGALVLDYGGGTVESEAVAQNFLDQFEATEMLYDPFNQTPEHNREVLRTLRNNGGADVAVCSNVLNVIKEQDVRLDVINKINKLLKAGGTAYITVYEGGGHGAGAATQRGKSYQNNAKLETYLEEIQTAFPEAVRKGSVIVAPKTSSVAAAIDLDSIDLEALERELKEGCEEYLTGPDGGFLPSGSPKEDRWDMTADEMYVVEVSRDEGRIRCEVRAELGYESMEKLIGYLDPIVAAYDEGAYFEMEEPGIATAFISDDSIYGSTDIEANIDDDRLARARERWLEPPEYEEEDPKPDVDVDFTFSGTVLVEDDGDWDFETDSYQDNIDDYTEEDIDIERIDEDFCDLLAWHIPEAAGRYDVSGKAHLHYYTTYDDHIRLDSKKSSLDDIKVVNAGKVESKTEVKAAMTEEELDNAILNGGPFDLDDFRKYKSVPREDNSVKAEDVKVGDVIEITEDASEVNLGTVVRILSINDPKENWIDYTFKCVVREDPGEQTIEEGSVIDLHFDKDDYLGPVLDNEVE